tara:strand:+ start:825 stop:1004 length:180 start_codon:yes stop_codon:yes gene_type:complete
MVNQAEFERERNFLEWFHNDWIKRIGEMNLNELLMVQGSTELKISHLRREVIEGMRKEK